MREVLVKVKVKPHARQEIIKLNPNGVFLVSVHAAPERGKANRRMMELLAAKFNVKASSLTLVAGASSREKIVRALLP